MTNTRFNDVLRFINEAGSSDELVKYLQLPADLAVSLYSQKTIAGGMLTSADQLLSVAAPARLTQISDAIGKFVPSVAPVEVERQNFVPLILENPNYFGNLEGSAFKAVKAIKFNTTYEELVCVGLQPQMDRLEAVFKINRPTGYGGDICALGSYEYVRFFVDLHDNGIFHDVGLTSLRVHDIPGAKPLCYSVYRDFTSIKKFCTAENVVKVRAILSWNAAPPSNPNFVPVWGNRIDAEVQIRPKTFYTIGDFVKDIDLAKIKLPDPIGPVIDILDPNTKVPVAATKTLSLVERQKIYLKKDVPVHRYAFNEVQSLLSSGSAPAQTFSALQTSPLMSLGLAATEIDGIFGKLQVKTDGDTSFEQLSCIGARPSNEVLEGVITIKKPLGYSGSLCSTGSREYVAFWVDFSDGTGFHYLNTTSVDVHDLSTVPADGIKYAVFTTANFAKWRVPCQVGARIGRLRAILSWETAPPPGNPNYVPVWGNRLECLIQIRPGVGVSHVPLIETIGDVPVNRIDQTLPNLGMATGELEIANTSVNVSPFGGEVTITGEIGLPPDGFLGGAAPFKYKIEVQKLDGVDTYHPLLNDVTVSVAEWNSGSPIFCDIFSNFVCQQVLHPTNDGDGLGDGWYPYLEDTTGPFTRHLVTSVLGRWQTTAAMEGLWKIKITAKDPNVTPPTVFPGIQEITVRIDNTYPVGSLAIVSATFNGQPITAVNCGKFPVGTIITGSYSAHDPGTPPNELSADFQHFGSLSFGVLPGGPANGASVSPAGRSYPTVGTTGEDGTWTLDTHGMDPCGYVIHMEVVDRTNVNSTGNPYPFSTDVGFCLEAAPVVASPK
jgi:hypothetical protein